MTTVTIVKFLHLTAMAIAVGAGLARFIAARSAARRPEQERTTAARPAAAIATLEMIGWHAAFVFGVTLAVQLSAMKLPFIHAKMTIALIGAVAATLLRRKSRRFLADADKPPSATWESDVRMSLPAILGSGPLALLPLVMAISALTIAVFRHLMNMT
jgi:hypothetical protein